MHYCRFESTAEALEEVVYDMQDGIDFKSLSESEKTGYNKMVEMCKTILELDTSQFLEIFRQKKS